MRDDHPATQQTCKGHALHRRARHLDDIGMTKRAKGSCLARVTEDLAWLLRVPRPPAGVRVTTRTSWPRTESHRASSSENRSSPPRDGANASPRSRSSSRQMPALRSQLAKDSHASFQVRLGPHLEIRARAPVAIRSHASGISDPPQPVRQCSDVP